MLNITSEELFEYAEKTGFLQNQLEKAIRLLGVLDFISDHPFLRDCFVLKGGTALNLFIYDMPRLSVDIDLNFVKCVNKSQMLKDRKEIALIIPALYSGAYDIRKSQDEHALLQYEFRYKTVSGSADMLKIDVNFFHRQTMVTPVQLSFEKLGQSLRFNILTLEELLAAKIITLLSRYTPRDLYDVYHSSILQPNLDTTLLRLLLLYYGLVSRRKIEDLFQVRLDNITQSDIRRLLHPLLIRRQYPSRKEMITSASAFLDPLMALSKIEKEAINEFYATGNLPIQILFPDKGLAERAVRSPALAWKTKNIRSQVSS